MGLYELYDAVSSRSWKLKLVLLGVTRSAESKACRLHFLAHFLTKWDNI